MAGSFFFRTRAKLAARLRALEDHRVAVAVGSDGPESDHTRLGSGRVDHRNRFAAHLAFTDGGPALRAAVGESAWLGPLPNRV